MLEKKQKNMCETEAAFTLAMLLMNVLILAVIGGAVWLVHSSLSENNSLNTFLRGGFIQ